jgi:hypothetical protein
MVGQLSLCLLQVSHSPLPLKQRGEPTDPSSVLRVSSVRSRCGIQSRLLSSHSRSFQKRLKSSNLPMEF